MSLDQLCGGRVFVKGDHWELLQPQGAWGFSLRKGLVL